MCESGSKRGAPPRVSGNDPPENAMLRFGACVMYKCPGTRVRPIGLYVLLAGGRHFSRLLLSKGWVLGLRTLYVSEGVKLLSP